MAVGSSTLLSTCGEEVRMKELISNVLAAAGFVLLTIGAALVAPAAGFLTAGGCCVLVSRLVAE